jgi:uncharacterized protein
MDVRELRRLEHLRGLLPAARVGQPPKLLMFCLPGFSADLAAEAAGRPDGELIDLERLYRGSGHRKCYGLMTAARMPWSGMDVIAAT